MSSLEWTDHRVDAREVAVPLSNCVLVRLGEVDGDVLRKLQERRYDQGPVLGLQGEPCGIIETVELAALYAQGRQLSADHPAIDATRVSADTALHDFLEVMSQKRAALVWEGGAPHGLVTISDLNRHAFRAALYRVFADLEVALADLIVMTYMDPWGWIRYLSEDQQVLVLGFWEVTKRAGVDTGPLAGCTLTNLIRVVADDQGLRERMGYGTASEAWRRLRGLPQLRNKVMHPVRPLVLDLPDVARIRDTILRVADLRRRLEEK